MFRKNCDGQLVLAGQTRLPEASRGVLILVFPREDDAERLHLFPMDFSNRQFPSGAFRILNFTQRPVHGSIAGTLMKVEAGRNTVGDPKEQKRTLSVMFAYPGQSAQDSLLSTTWFYNPRHRYLVFLYPDEEGERVGIRTLRHFPKPETAESNGQTL